MKSKINIQKQDVMLNTNVFTQIIEQVPFPIEINDEHGIVKYVNKAFLKLFKIPSADLVVDKFNALDNPIFEKLYLKEKIKSAFSGKTVKIENIRIPAVFISEEFLSSRNEDWFLDALIFPIFEHPGKLQFVITVFNDITKRKKAEKLLINSKQQSLDIINFLPDATFVIDHNHKVIAWNRAMENLTGIESKEIIGKGNYEYSIPIYGCRRPILADLLLNSDSYFENLYNKIEKNNDCLIAEDWIKTYDNKDLYIWFKSSKLYNIEGEVIGAVESIRDITDYKIAQEKISDSNVNLEKRVKERTNELELTSQKLEKDILKRKQIERKLLKSEERWNYALEGSSEGVWDLDIESNEIFFSKRWKEVLGFSENEISNKWNQWYDRIHKKDLEVFNSDFNKHLIGESSKLLTEHRLKCKDDKFRWMLVRGQVFDRSEDGKPLRIIGTILDIHKRKLSEKKIFNALQKEKEINDIKTKFISMVSHEYRTPLTAIQSSAELLELFEKKLSFHEKTEHYKKINESISYLIDLLDDVLLINKPDAEKNKFTPKKMEFISTCRKIVEENETLINTTNLKIVFSSDIKSYKVKIDIKLLKQIITNLLSNAIKYSLDGGNILFNVELNDNFVVFTVEDQGLGISVNDQKDLYEPFVRGHNTTNISGTGLGLFIVKRCVDLHKGKISCSSREGIGTIFKVFLPIN